MDLQEDLTTCSDLRVISEFTGQLILFLRTFLWMINIGGTKYE